MLKIVDVREKPWWKIWRGFAHWEVVVECEEWRKTFYIFTSFPHMIPHYLKNKIERGSQWKNERPKINPEIEKLIGKEFEGEVR